MSSSPILSDVSRELRTASQAIEEIFVGIGGRLETAVHACSTITAREAESIM